MRKTVLKLAIIALLTLLGILFTPANTFCQEINTELVIFKLRVVEHYLKSQWQLLSENNILVPKYINIVYSATEELCKKTVLTIEGEQILAFDQDLNTVISTKKPIINQNYLPILRSTIQNTPRQVIKIENLGFTYASGFYSEEFDIYVVLLYDRKANE